ncbi:hypothetical protein ACVR1I_09360 [Streptococcus cameli]
MFKKLLKYEFKSLGKWYLSLYGLITLLSVVLGFWMRSVVNRSIENVSTGPEFEGWLFGISWFAFMLLIAGLGISTFILVIRRFYSNIYGREGYLTMTLPVTSHQIILSKFLASYIWYTLAGLMTALSIAIIGFLAIPTEVYPEIQKGIWTALLEFEGIDFPFWNLIVNGFLESISSILLAYFAISIGQLFKDHRVLMAVVAYVGISFVLGTFSSIATLSLGLFSASNSEVFFPFSHPFHLILNIILIPVYYFGTHYIMTKKLNLQ